MTHADDFRDTARLLRNAPLTFEPPFAPTWSTYGDDHALHSAATARYYHEADARNDIVIAVHVMERILGGEAEGPMAATTAALLSTHLTSQRFGKQDRMAKLEALYLAVEKSWTPSTATGITRALKELKK